MKVSLSLTKPTVQKFTELKNKMVYSSVFGDYKAYKSASKEYASLAVKDFDMARTAPGATAKNVPLFSKVGMNMLKVWFLNLLRIKTPQEKLLAKMVNEFRAKQYVKP